LLLSISGPCHRRRCRAKLLSLGNQAKCFQLLDLLISPSHRSPTSASVRIRKHLIASAWSRTMDTQWRHKSKISEKLGRCGRQNMLRSYLKIWDWELSFGRAVKRISSSGVRSPCVHVILPLALQLLYHI
jgi:hypothetical protein